MSSYTTAVTTAGTNKIALAISNNTPISFAQMAIGDGNGSEITPASNMTQLVNEVWRGGVTSSMRDPSNPNQVIIEASIPAADGPFTLREVAIYTADGVMFAIGSYPDAFKPSPAQGASAAVTVRFYIAISTNATVTVVLQPDTFIPFGRMSVPFVGVKSATLTTPPTSPATGDTYLVPAGATGAWAGQTDLAQWNGTTAWVFATPENSTIIGIADTMLYKTRTSSGWIDIDLTGQNDRANDWKNSVRVATVANVATLSGLLTIDGVTLAANERVLVRAQTTASQNGIYVVSSGSWVRANDADLASLSTGATTYVSEGSTYAGRIFILTTANPVVAGTTALAFTEFGNNASRLTIGTISDSVLPARLLASNLNATYAPISSVIALSTPAEAAAGVSTTTAVTPSEMATYVAAHNAGPLDGYSVGAYIFTEQYLVTSTTGYMPPYAGTWVSRTISDDGLGRSVVYAMRNFSTFSTYSLWQRIA